MRTWYANDNGSIGSYPNALNPPLALHPTIVFNVVGGAVSSRSTAGEIGCIAANTVRICSRACRIESGQIVLRARAKIAEHL